MVLGMVQGPLVRPPRHPQGHHLHRWRYWRHALRHLTRRIGELKMMNWKTTVAGLGVIAIPILNDVIPVLPPKYQGIATAVVAGLGLIFAKDSNVTGGTVKQ